MPTDVEVCQANPASFFSFGPYAWQPFGVLIQNRSNIAFYANEGTYCDETNFRFLVPPYYQGAFLVSGNQISFKFDKNGTLGPIPALERATVFITDTFIAPGLFPFAATVRDALNPAQSNIGLVSGTGVLTANFANMAPGLYEIYGWRCEYFDSSLIPGDVVNGIATLGLASGGTIDIGSVSTGATPYNPEYYDLNNSGTNFFTSTVTAGPTFDSAALTAGIAYYILGWQVSVLDIAGTAGDARAFQAELSHNGGLGAIDWGIGSNGGIAGTVRMNGHEVYREYKRPFRVTPAGAGTTLRLAVNWGAATTGLQAVDANLWFTTANNSNVSSRRNAIGLAQNFSPPILISVQTTTNLQVSVSPIGVPKGAMNMDSAVFYAPLRF